jgi:hypothetical protein
MNNISYYNNDSNSKVNFIWDKITCSDEILLKKMYTNIVSTVDVKLGLIEYLLKSDYSISIKTKKDIIKLFSITSILNNKYSMGSNEWDFKIVKDNNSYKLFVQNSITKYCKNNNSLYDDYLNPLKNIFTKSNIKFNYYEFKVKRYYKTIDIVFVFDI